MTITPAGCAQLASPSPRLPERGRGRAEPVGYLRVLQLQELLLALQASGVAGQLAGAADDPVAGDQDAQRVAADCGAGLLGVLAPTLW